jgi:hypothetical protein
VLKYPGDKLVFVYSENDLVWIEFSSDEPIPKFCKKTFQTLRPMQSENEQTSNVIVHVIDKDLFFACNIQYIVLPNKETQRYLSLKTFLKAIFFLNFVFEIGINVIFFLQDPKKMVFYQLS